MARLRIRLRFNPGRTGAPMDKLGEFASQTEKFLRSLANDIGVSAKKGEWLAVKFTNDSVAFDSLYAEVVTDAVAAKGREAIIVITGDDPLAACSKGIVSYGTIAEFSRIGKMMDPDETFFIGVYESDVANEPEWKEVAFSKTAEIRQLLDAPLVSYGSVQGVLYAWHFGAERPFFNLRELSSGDLIKCFYISDLHDRIHEATEDKNTVVHVYGDIKWDRATNLIIELDAINIEIARTLSDFEFDGLFGSMPKFTGSLSTSEYIDWLRGDGE